jgi:hypothetical protein
VFEKNMGGGEGGEEKISLANVFSISSLFSLTNAKRKN